MPINLNQPLDAANTDPAVAALLGDLQGNILKGHGRGDTANIFLQFDPAQAAAVKAWIRKLAGKVTSAGKQMADTVKWKAAMKKSGGTGKNVTTVPVLFFFLSARGYAALSVPAARLPKDASFLAGMKVPVTNLLDPAPATWDKTFRPEVHAMVLIGGEAAQVKKESSALKAGLPAGVRILGSEAGSSWKNENGDGIEHFGYVDGRSQPLFFVKEIENERNTTDGINIWDPAFPLKQVLVKDPGGSGASSFGSYFVFRKLEQNVKGFKAREELLADHLGLKGEDRERAGALMVGRFEDGTPVVLQNEPGTHSPVPNNFDYRNDAQATRCPFHSHIRKTNPRGESVRPGLAPSLAAERAHIMARRGITYGNRKTKKAGAGVEFTDQPTGKVGLLFMAYQSDLGNQFEFTQAIWANNLNFVNSGTGTDPVIGQGAAGGQSCPIGWAGNPATATFKKFDFRGFVTLKGGEYFFAPSLSTLKSL